MSLIDLNYIVERLKNKCPIFEGRVFETVECINFDISDKKSPVIFVYLVRDKTEFGGGEGQTLIQKHRSIIATNIVIRNETSFTDKRLTALSQMQRQIRQQVFDALINYIPPDQCIGIYHESGENRKLDELNKTCGFIDYFACLIRNRYKKDD